VIKAPLRRDDRDEDDERHQRRDKSFLFGERHRSQEQSGGHRQAR